MSNNECQFVIVAGLLGCYDPFEVVIDGKRLCADHAVSMYPDIEGMGVSSALYLHNKNRGIL